MNLNLIIECSGGKYIITNAVSLFWCFDFAHRCASIVSNSKPFFRHRNGHSLHECMDEHLLFSRNVWINYKMNKFCASEANHHQPLCSSSGWRQTNEWNEMKSTEFTIGSTIWQFFQLMLLYRTTQDQKEIMNETRPCRAVVANECMAWKMWIA